MDIYDEIYQELQKARAKYDEFHSLHEGYAVILEELDELWELIRASKAITATDEMRAECIQIAAMCVRFVEDLHG